MGINEEDFLRALQQRIADIAAGTSTLRGQLTGEGSIIAVQQFLAKRVSLREFVVEDAAAYRVVLDRYTEELLAAASALKWGSARKVLNIFVRDCMYDRFLTERIPLHNSRRFMEIPLDSHVGKWLRNRAEHLQEPELPPRWNTIIGLTPIQNDMFQRFASKLVRSPEFDLPKIGLERVDLDVLVWRQLGDQNRSDESLTR